MQNEQVGVSATPAGTQQSKESRMEKILANQNAAKKSNNITGSSFRAELARQEAERLNAAQAPEKTTVDDVAAPEQGQSQPVTSEQSESHKQSVEAVTDEAQKPEAQVPETVEAEPEDTEAAQSEQSVLSQLQSLDPEKRELCLLYTSDAADDTR